METPPGVPTTLVTSSKPVPSPLITWAPCVQIVLGCLLAGCLLFLAGKSLLLSLQAGPSTIPSQRINLNFANRAELMLLPGIGEQGAERIIKTRAEKGLFKNIEELRGVSGIGPIKLASLRDWVYISSESASATMESQPLQVEPSKRPGAKPKKGTNLSGPIDVNKASADQLMLIPGIGPKISQRIIDQRDQKPFQKIADLRRVPGIGAKTLEKIKPYVTISQ